jgi:predicted aspartyl protease
MTDLGAFRTTIEIEHPAGIGPRVTLRDVLVDTGAELSWIPATILEELRVARKKTWHFRQADGTVLERSTGYVILHVAGTETADEVVFGDHGDLVLLGARSLEGLNLRVEPANKRLVDAGPAPAAPLPR